MLSDLKRERAEVLARFRQDQHPLGPEAMKEIRDLFAHRIDCHLDAGHGECYLRHPAVAKIVENALRHFVAARYVLHAWCIMPNHIHVVLTPVNGHSLPSIMKSLKGFTGKEANRVLDRDGPFWQIEYYDHLIRDDSEFAHAVRYTLENPIKAKLRDWPWVWASADALKRIAG
ncbi:MAG: isochorismate synthase [Verrucomicrobia bacterium]|nr:isochorismate synthase [Verrucomicrobiota bacterium]